MAVAAVKPSLIVTSSAHISVLATVDLVAWYGAFDEAARARYWGTHLTEFLEADWQRPVAYLDYLVSGAGEDVDVPLGSAGGRAWVDVDVEGSCVESRSDVKTPSTGRSWTEDDFEALIAAVRWVSPADDGLAPETMNVPFAELEYLTA